MNDDDVEGADGRGNASRERARVATRRPRRREWVTEKSPATTDASYLEIVKVVVLPRGGVARVPRARAALADDGHDTHHDARLRGTKRTERST